MANFEIGKYVCEVTAQGFDKINNAKKTPYFWLEFKPMGRINSDDPDGQLYGCDDYLRTVQLFLSEKAAPYTRERLESLGWTTGRFQDLEPGGACSFVGMQVTLECTHRQVDNKVYDDWNFPFGSSSQAKNEPGVARDLDALFGRATKKPPTATRAATRTSQTPPVANPQPAKDPTYATEDIPF